MMITTHNFIVLSLIVCATLGVTYLLTRVMQGKGYKVNTLLNILLMLAISTVLVLVGSSFSWILKGIAFALILLYASCEDYSKREADDFLWVMILLLCICNASSLSLWSMLGGVFVTFVPTFAIAILGRVGGIGGADIKIAGACGLMLGFMGGSIGYAVGLLSAVLFNIIYNKVKHRKNSKSFPMLPFLSIGFMLGYFIF